MPDTLSLNMKTKWFYETIVKLCLVKLILCSKGNLSYKINMSQRLTSFIIL